MCINREVFFTLVKLGFKSSIYYFSLKILGTID